METSANLPPSVGPHGVDMSIPRGVTRTRSLGHAARINAQLDAYVRSEAEKQRRNVERAASAGKAGQ